ncbi:MAG: efflux RND transporter permease subunit, partial [Isosphaeraceae bacterium]
VIMIENCVRRLSGHGLPEDRERPLLDVLRDAAVEVRKPTMFGELIITIVYLPILALQGMEGKLFRPMALTVIFALAGSMVLSLTLMPVLASLVLRRTHDPEPRFLALCRRHRVTTSFGIAVLAICLPLVLLLRSLGVSLSGIGHPLAVYAILREHLAIEELILLLLMPAALLALCLTALLLGGPVQEREVFLVRWARACYEPVLRRALRHPVLTICIASAFFVLSVWIARDLGAEFMPKLDEGAIAVQAWRLPSVSLEKSVRDTTRIEQVLKAFPEVQTAVSRTGRAEIATDPMGVETSDVIVMLRPRQEWTTLERPDNLARVMGQVLEGQNQASLMQRAEAVFAEFQKQHLFNPKDKLVVAIDELLNAAAPGNVFSYSQPIELRVQELIAGVHSDLGISLYGDDLDVLGQKGDEIVAVLQSIPGAAEAKAEQIAGLPVLKVDVDRDAIARYGVNTADVLDTVGAIGGKIVGQVFEGQQRFALQVRFPRDVRQNLEQLRRIKVADSQGRQIPLEQLARLGVEQGPLQILRQRVRRRHLIECNVRGRDVASFVAEAQRRVAAEVNLPPGYSLHWGGQFENLVSASGRLAIVVPLALGLIFILLYSTFHSARLAALIYLAVPMAAIGGIVALMLRGMPFSISAGVGFVALFGVAVLNGLVLVSHAEHVRLAGAAPNEAAYEAGEVRLRPVLTTALVASLGFLPMALATSAGAEVQRPLATVVIGGLISSTLLTLLVVPAIYHWFVPAEPSALNSFH